MSSGEALYLPVPPPSQQRPMGQPCFNVVVVEKGQVRSQHEKLCDFLVGIILNAMLEATVVVVPQITPAGLVEIFGHALLLLLLSSRFSALKLRGRRDGGSMGEDGLGG